MLRADGTFPHDQANVMKIFYGGKIIMSLCQLAVHFIFFTLDKWLEIKKPYFCILFAGKRI